MTSPELSPSQPPAQPGRDLSPVEAAGSEAGGAAYLSLQEAAALFDVSLRALRRRVTLGEVAAHKANGVRGREWRVSIAALEQAGYALRTSEPTEVEGAQLEVRRLTDALVAERARSARLDSELGYALLTIGRLRGRLKEAGIDPNESFGAELGHRADNSCCRRES